ncbi:MAG: N-acetyl-gamma-glutamyl-phosphate reductase [Nitrospinota bacterium]|nr:MAG: N-acetyl-gamma-glutamyl-phosphate reductase [Nitrospinota bacterium]
MIRAQVVGATGYGGVGIVELLLRHPEVEITSLMGKQDVGQPLSSYFPHLQGFCDRVVEESDPERIGEGVDVVICSTPDRVGMQYAKRVLERGAALIDFSGDFRFRDPQVYAAYARFHPKTAGLPHAAPDLLAQATYGLPELFREQIREARLVGNPGCFAVAAILGLAPVVKEHLVELSSIVCDGKTGISGAGKKPSALHHFPERNENVAAYRIAQHQHSVEMEEVLSLLAGERVSLTFVPHLIPVTRGIICTIYATLRQQVKIETLQDLYTRFYAGSPFVRMRPPGSCAGLKSVIGSNFCDISLTVDDRNGRLVIVSWIDNLVKGQAGSALQNLNVMFGFPEEMGLDRPGFYP